MDMVRVNDNVNEIISMTMANLCRQHHRSLDSYYKSSRQYLYLFGVMSYYFIPSKLLKLIVYNFKLILLMFSYFLNNTTTFVILMRKRHLNNKTFVFPKGVILKRENNFTP
jgi:hypothetical protein